MKERDFSEKTEIEFTSSPLNGPRIVFIVLASMKGGKNNNIVPVTALLTFTHSNCSAVFLTSLSVCWLFLFLFS